MLGAIVLIEFKDYYWLTIRSGNWEHEGWVVGLAVNVDLKNKKISGITVAPSRYTIGKNINKTIDEIEDKRFKNAAIKALKSRKIKKFIEGKKFEIIPGTIIKQDNTECITIFIKILENGKEKMIPVFVKNGKIYLENEIMEVK